MKYPALVLFALLAFGFFAIPSAAMADDYAGICATMVDGVSSGKSVYLSVRDGNLTGYVRTGSLLGRIPIKASVDKSGRFRAKIANGGGNGFVSGKVKRSKIVARGYIESKKTGRVRLFIDVPPRLLRGDLSIVGEYYALLYLTPKVVGYLYVTKSPDAGDDEDYYDIALKLKDSVSYKWDHVNVTNNEALVCTINPLGRTDFHIGFESAGRVTGVKAIVSTCNADGSGRREKYICYPY
jgi:hypothetical protein